MSHRLDSDGSGPGLLTVIGGSLADEVSVDPDVPDRVAN